MDNDRANDSEINHLLECADKATDTSKMSRCRIIPDLIDRLKTESNGKSQEG